MNCTNCGQPLHQGVKFCGHCGHRLGDTAHPERSASHERQRASSFVPALKTEEGRARYFSIVREKQAQTRRGRWVLFVLFLATAALGTLAYMTPWEAGTTGIAALIHRNWVWPAGAPALFLVLLGVR